MCHRVATAGDRWPWGLGTKEKVGVIESLMLKMLRGGDLLGKDPESWRECWLVGAYCVPGGLGEP